MSLSPKELEYLAECEPVQIVSNFHMKKMSLISGDIGPLRPGIPCQVPLWMAVNLSRSAKCKIIPPDWMNVDVLQRIKHEEKNSPLFTHMPAEHYMAIGKLLFQACPGEIKDCDEVKTLMKDIWDTRYAKLRRSVKLFLSQEELPLFAQVDHLTMMEMCQIRPFLTHSLEQIYRLKKTASLAQAANEESQNMSTTMSSSIGHSQSQQSQSQR
ncbi:unnamed protein product [Allacma fusca]|uniref:DNA replication complex GINS protein PSF2 n=1 Tax=Allacma fusca TaxID=39272 RepID=A0A8J2KEF9_9HEXA|nr:unnamed protein product [Allacma fusca]